MQKAGIGRLYQFFFPALPLILLKFITSVPIRPSVIYIFLHFLERTVYLSISTASKNYQNSTVKVKLRLEFRVTDPLMPYNIYSKPTLKPPLTSSELLFAYSTVIPINHKWKINIDVNSSRNVAHCIKMNCPSQYIKISPPKRSQKKIPSSRFDAKHFLKYYPDPSIFLHKCKLIRGLNQRQLRELISCQEAALLFLRQKWQTVHSCRSIPFLTCFCMIYTPKPWHTSISQNSTCL